MAELALRFTLSTAGISCAIVASTSSGHLHDNIAAAQRGPLDAAAVTQIQDAFRQAEERSGGSWLHVINNHFYICDRVGLFGLMPLPGC